MSDKPDSLERGQSPPPERSSGKQMHDPPASGHGTNHIEHKEDVNKEAIQVSPHLGRDYVGQALTVDSI
jgi:hypothetical protein